MEGDSIQGIVAIPFVRSSIKRRTTKRGTFVSTTSQSQNTIIYSKNDMKMLVFLSYMKMFDQHRKAIIQKCEQQADQKLRRTQMHFNRLSSTLSIQPIKKQIILLNNVHRIFEKIDRAITIQLKNNLRTIQCKKICNVSQMQSLTSSVDMNQNFKFTNSSYNTNQFQVISKRQSRKTYKQQIQNVDPTLIEQSKFHKRNTSDLPFVAKRESIRQLSNYSKQYRTKITTQRKWKYFISKKKEQVKFLRKMTVQFTTNQSQYKALMQSIQVFLRNLNRSNYFMKVIDQDQLKCQKINVYINQLSKIFEYMISTYLLIIKHDKSLQIIQENICRITSQFKQLPIYIQQYYEKSNKLMKYLKGFSLSVNSFHLMTLEKAQCARLAQLILQARYTLRYLQKEIQNIQSKNKQFCKMTNWQKAYRAKFLPKNIYC